MASDIDIVVPTLNDSDALQELLPRLSAMKPHRVVVVAGEANEGEARCCEEAGAEYIVSAPCRGRQLDMGARASAASVLWFLHADATPNPNSLDAIREAIGAGARGGFFKFRFANTQRSLAVQTLEAAIGLRCRWGIPYGDQGIFADKEAYLAAGGFAHEPLFEEVPLVRGLRELGPFIGLPLTIGVSARRWNRDGWLRRTAHNRWLALRYSLGASPASLAAAYRKRN